MAHNKSNGLLTNSSSKEFALYVNNLPVELSEIGFKQIFNHYGKIIGHLYRPNTTWAYITYGKYNEAEAAIKDLNNVPPLHLKISFAHEKGSNKMEFVKPPVSQDVVQQESCTVQDKHLNKSSIQTKEQGRPSDMFKKLESKTGFPTCTYTPDDDLLYSYPSDSYTYNPYEKADPFDSTHALWTRGQLMITPDCKRHVSLGRGYTMYEIPDPSPEIQKQICKVHELRTTGLYEYDKDMLENSIGKCETCGNITKFTCEKCHTFYCSRKCQKDNWPQHKYVCQPIPALVSTINSTHLSQPNTEGYIPIRSKGIIQTPLRRPRKSVDSATSLNKSLNTVSKDQDTTDVQVTICNDSSQNSESKCFKTTDQFDTYQKNKAKEKVPFPMYNETNFQSKGTGMTNMSNFKHKHIIHGKNSSFEKSQESLTCSDKVADDKKSDSIKNSTKKQQYVSAEDVMKIEEDIAFSKHAFLSKSGFTEVRIIVNMGRECWIQNVENDEKLRELMSTLQSEADKAEKVVPVLGNMYAVKYEDLWHRGLIKQVKPLIIHYVDYGNDDFDKTNDVRKLGQFQNIPRFAATARLSEKASQKYKHLTYGDIIFVKTISVDSNNVINVEVQGENDAPILEVDRVPMPQVDQAPIPQVDRAPISQVDRAPISQVDRTPTTPVSDLKYSVNIMPIGERGVLEIHAELSNNTYSVTLLSNNTMSEFEELLNELPVMCEQRATNSGYKPEIGKLICGQRLDGDWLRGYVLSLESPLKMVVIDEARMMEINKVVPCPDNFLKICTFGAKCKIINAENKFDASGQFEFKVVTRNGENEIEIEIYRNNEEKLKAIVTPWTPMPEQKGIQYAQLKNDSEVCLTAYCNHAFLFARSLVTEEVERYNRIMQNVAKCAQTAPSLKEPPVVGQMVIAQYIDDNYYRAIVTAVADDKVTISYIDFGNREVTNMKKLKILNDNLKQLQSCTSKIILKDVPQDKPMTNEISDYLSNLVGREVPLICTFTGIPSKDGVYLKSHDGDNINKTISELLIPTWKRSDEKDLTCYTLNDIAVASLGKVGDVVNVAVAHVLEAGYKYTMYPLDYDLITHISDIMPKSMAKYCESNDHYIPRENELCLALFNGEWCRATCYRRSETASTSTVFFIDHGCIESISHKDIRLMPKDFMTPSALISVCDIVNLAPLDSQGKYSSKIEKRISELIDLNIPIEIKIVKCDENAGLYDIELPSIRKKLVEEGLL
ncbi:uncharacterized protein LOC128889026 [Hylaeus anthracinus]|uniref:uncharacterized protein LOC128889026 n=1 Tax=Hylaeus anthracinus TaxID=313031 RepID=UPI0023B9B824|nr:uncharacterized protein LOC128889026 [Hylaeus anthracinus]XP_054002303.1 uncharacterized protein LOC128889026 [Hylaeus anthracinus]